MLGGREKLLIIRLMGTRLSSASLSPNCLCKYLCLCVCVSEDGGTSGYHTDNKGMGVEERVYSQHMHLNIHTEIILSPDDRTVCLSCYTSLRRLCEVFTFVLL